MIHHFLLLLHTFRFYYTSSIRFLNPFLRYYSTCLCRDGIVFKLFGYAFSSSDFWLKVRNVYEFVLKVELVRVCLLENIEKKWLSFIFNNLFKRNLDMYLSLQFFVVSYFYSYFVPQLSSHVFDVSNFLLKGTYFRCRIYFSSNYFN